MTAGGLMILLEAYCFVYLHDAPHMDRDLENSYPSNVAHLLREELIEPADHAVDTPEYLPYSLTEKGAVFINEILKTPLPERSWEVRRN